MVNLDRFNNAIYYAVDYITKSLFSDSVNKIIIYGSCARGDFSNNSDVDVYIEFLHEVANEHLRVMRSDFMCGDLRRVDIDVHWGFKSLDLYEDLYHSLIRKEGVVVWCKENTLI